MEAERLTSHNQEKGSKVYEFTVENGYGVKTVVETHADNIYDAVASATDYVCSKQMELSETYIKMATQVEPSHIGALREQHYMLADLTIISIVERDKH